MPYARAGFYKPSLSHATAVQVITKGSEGQFDPNLLKAFQRCTREFEPHFSRIPGLNLFPRGAQPARPARPGALQRNAIRELGKRPAVVGSGPVGNSGNELRRRKSIRLRRLGRFISRPPSTPPRLAATIRQLPRPPGSRYVATPRPGALQRNARL